MSVLIASIETITFLTFSFDRKSPSLVAWLTSSSASSSLEERKGFVEMESSDMDGPFDITLFVVLPPRNMKAIALCVCEGDHSCRSRGKSTKLLFSSIYSKKFRSDRKQFRRLTQTSNWDSIRLLSYTSSAAVVALWLSRCFWSAVSCCSCPAFSASEEAAAADDDEEERLVSAEMATGGQSGKRARSIRNKLSQVA